MARPLPARAGTTRPGLHAGRIFAAWLLLAALLIGPGQAVKAMGDAGGTDAALVICHAGSGDAAPADGAGHHQGGSADCRLCPACHLVAQPVLPAGDAGLVAMARATARAHGAARPPATGPPSAARAATPPTGPPAAST